MLSYSVIVYMVLRVKINTVIVMFYNILRTLPISLSLTALGVFSGLSMPTRAAEEEEDSKAIEGVQINPADTA